MQIIKLKWIAFLLGAAAAALMAHGPLVALRELSSRDEMYSHIPLIPVAALYFFWVSRKKVECVSGWSPAIGALVGVSGLILYWGATRLGDALQPQDRIAIQIFFMVILVQAVFITLFGLKAAREAAFPLLFLFLVVPFPSIVQDWVVSLLQRGSAEATHFIFSLTWVPFFREGFVFQVPGISVEVAPQCGGIRSGIALAITCLVAGKLFLARAWSRAALIVACVPITIFKNGLRIVGLTLGAIYIDPRILESQLHRSGGIPFFALAMAMTAPVLWALYKLENRRKKPSEPPGQEPENPGSKAASPGDGNAENA
ncbi:MAG: exosortase/archaeosortase family protein [bacterium]